MILFLKSFGPHKATRKRELSKLQNETAAANFDIKGSNHGRI
jgi:hypothetical protein